MHAQHIIGIVLFGLGLIGLGLFLIGDYLNLFDQAPIINQYWPILSFFIGLILVNQRANMLLGASIMWVSVLLLLERFDVFGGQTGKIILAVTILISGLMLVIFAADRSAWQQDDP